MGTDAAIRPADVSPRITCAPEDLNCSAINAAYGPPIVRGTIPKGVLSTSRACIVVWKQAQELHGLAAPIEISQSVKSPSKSSTQIEGTGSFGKLRARRTASIRASGVNADGSLKGCSRTGTRSGVTTQVYRNPQL